MQAADPGLHPAWARINEMAAAWHAERDDTGLLVVTPPRVCGWCAATRHRRCTRRMVAAPGSAGRGPTIPCGCDRHSKVR